MISCNNENLSVIEIEENLSYEESLTYANELNDNLYVYFEELDFTNQKINSSALVQDFIENHADEMITNLLSQLGENEKILYEENYSKSGFNIEEIEELEISVIEKSYLSQLYTAASSEDSGKVLEMLESFKEDVTENSDLENLNLIFAFIETNQNELFAHKSSLTTKGGCQSAAETGGIIGGVFGMVRGAIAGGVTGTVLGLNPGTGAAGAVVGGVAGGTLGFAEGALLGYIGCRIFGAGGNVEDYNQ